MGAETALPGFFKKRKLLFAEPADKASLGAEGRAGLDAGLLDSSLEFFVRAGDREGLERVAEAARAAGDTFSFEAAHKALGKPAATADWVAIGETALAAGRLWFAYRAFEKADNQDGLERTRRDMHAAGITP